MERKLAAILYADVAGYSRLIDADEEGTHRVFRSHFDAVSNTIQNHGGRIVHTAGDAVLAEFPSIVNALKCAIAVQRSQAERNRDLPDHRKLQFRIGVNFSDVIVDGDELYGEGVNLAARLEGLAEPGGICIAGRVHRQVKGKLELAFEDLGRQQLKNIAEPVRVFRVKERNADATPAGLDIAAEPLALPDKPSIAVLPFENLSSDPEQNYFSDGMAEEIITALSRVRWFFVIARNSSFTYKGRSIDVTQVAKELGVRYVLEGSVRKAGNRVRVIAQLIDGVTGHHIWAERYDRERDDIFALQDESAEAIVATVEPELGAVERQRARRKPPHDLNVWDLYQRGLWHLFDDVNRDGLTIAKGLFQRACELDPDFAAAHAELAYTHVAEIVRGLSDDSESNLRLASDAAERAVALDSRDPAARCALGRVLIFKHAYERSVAEMKAAISLNANFDRAYYGPRYGVPVWRQSGAKHPAI